MGIPVSFRVFRSIDGTPYDGITFASFVEYKRTTGGADTALTQPTISGSGGGTGRYNFTTLDGQALVGSEINWLVQLPADATAQYEFGTLDGLELAEPVSGSVALQSNALTAIATLRTELGLDTSLDDVLARLINGASDSIEEYCGRKFGYVAGVVEDVASYGTELVHVSRRPVWQITSVEVQGSIFTSDYWKIHNAKTGAVYGWRIWPDSAPVELSAAPHVRAGFEDKTTEITYCGGFALATFATPRVAPDAPLWLPTTGYIAGQKVQNGDNVYLLNTPGTSASSGGPTGQGTAIADGGGGLLWDFLCPAFPQPTDLEEACLQLAVYRFRKRGRDVGTYSETVGRATRSYAGRQSGPEGIPGAIMDILDMYKSVR